MSKHHVTVGRSKTLDVPIIITSTTSDPIECNFGANLTSVNNSNNELSTKTMNLNKFKLDKGLSLDSHYLKSQNSLSSSSTSNEMNDSSSNSISSSNNSIINNNFQFQNQQYLSPPSSISSSSRQFNINADFEIYTSIQHKRTHENSSNPNFKYISANDQ